MSYFDEQLRFREQSDDAAMADALDELAGAVMGGRLRAALDDRALAGSAIDEVLKYYRFKPREEESLPEDCTAETQLDLRLRPFGLLRRPVTLDRGWYRRAVGAMMGTLRADGSAVALIPGRLGGYRFFDARTGRWVRLNRRTEALLDDEALCFYRPLPQRALRVADLLKFMGSLLSAGDVLLLLLFSAGAALLGLISPLITRRLFGDVLASGSPQVLAALAVFAVCFSAAQLCFSACRGLCDTRIGLRQDLAVQAAVMSRILSLPAGFFRDYSAGELSQRAAYVRSLCSTLFGAVGMTGLSAVFSLVYIGQIFTFAPSLVLPSLAVTVLSTLLSLGTTLAQMRITRERMELSARTGGLTYAALTGIRKVKLAGAEKRVFARWARSSARETALSYNPPLFLRLSATLNLALTLGGELLLYATAVRSGVGVADYYAFNASYGMIAGALASLASIALTAADIRPTLDMARPILEAVPEASEEREQVTRLRGAIELSHVSFRYADGLPNVLDDFSLRIMPGEYVAIVGATGCGKSTLLRLLLGFERPQKGSIYYDRRDLTRLDLSSLRRCIGTVMQDGQLFMGDIYSNIMLSAPWLTLDDAWRAAEIADIADDIRQMPMGMQTLITEGQGGISGGQKQRLMIARAVAPQPGVLMFDEATSALDNVTQRKVSDAIDGLHCTRIAIAHRLSTVRHADRILFLEGGRIAEEGTYDELIARGGRFAELVARQRPELDFESET